MQAGWADYAPKDRTSRWLGATAVVAVHALLVGALVDGLKQPASPITAAPQPTLVQRVILPATPSPPTPPPAPPPERARIVRPPPVASPAPAAAQPAPRAPLPSAAVPVEAPAAEAPAAAPAAAAAPVPSPTALATMPAAPAPQPESAAAGRAEIAVACPTQVQPEIPRRALQEGISGVVRAQALIRRGVVAEVTILSGPRIFHSAVRAAMLQYRCVSHASEIVAVQEFAFRIE